MASAGINIDKNGEANAYFTVRAVQSLLSIKQEGAYAGYSRSTTLVPDNPRLLSVHFKYIFILFILGKKFLSISILNDTLKRCIILSYYLYKKMAM